EGGGRGGRGGVGDNRGQVAVRDREHRGAQLVDLLAELRLTGGVVEQEAEAGRLRRSRREQGVQARIRERGGSRCSGQAVLRPPENRSIEVRLRVEVPVEHIAADTRLSRYVLEAGGCEPGVRKRASCGHKDLLTALWAAEQPSL